LGLTADKLLEIGIIDRIVKEPLGGAHYAPALVARELKKELIEALESVSKVSTESLIEQRYSRLRQIGYYANIPDESEPLGVKS
jgi:acetyl-CoA carboxylase carboxyl transferase subunit alpha